jgi:translation elongation factor EF-4
MNRWDSSDIVLCSAKEYIEVYEILEAIVKKKPLPQDNTEKAFE